MESVRELKQKLANHTTAIFKEPDGTIFKGKIVDTAMTLSSIDDVAYVLQKIQFEDRRQPLLRFGYYIIGKIGNAEGRWWWGQSCPIITSGDFKKLLSKAKNKGII